MKSRRQFIKEAGICAGTLLLFGFSGGSRKEMSATEVPILAYHNIGYKKDRAGYTVTPDEFKKHLEILCMNDYKPESLDNLVWGEFRTCGKKVIFTFDDAWEGQFRMDDNGEIDPDCAVGMLKSFYGREANATFFVSFDKGNTAFGQPEKEKYKLNWLLDNGFGIGNHTYDHVFLSELTEEGIKEQIAKADEKFEELLGKRWKAVKIFCYPGGEFPKTKNGMDIIKKRFVAAVRTKRGYKVVASPYPPIGYMYEIPRIGMYSGEKGENALDRITEGRYDPLSPSIPRSLRG